MHLISWCGNFAETQLERNFHMRKLSEIAVFYRVCKTAEKNLSGEYLGPCQIFLMDFILRK